MIQVSKYTYVCPQLLTVTNRTGSYKMVTRSQTVARIAALQQTI